jgi:transposase
VRHSREPCDDVASPPAPGTAAQKKTLHAEERDTPRVQRLRRAWWQKIGQRDPKHLVFVDESGITTALTRAYGRAPKGQRVVGSVPYNYGQTVTVLGGLALRGVVGMMSVEAPTDTDVFLSFLKRGLLPQLRDKDLVVLDRLGPHRVCEVPQMLRQAGAGLLFLPPYSHDFNPIELCWSKIKAHLRAQAARTRTALDRALTEALARVTRQDARAWFQHCGYSLH